MKQVTWLAVPLALAASLLNMNQAFRRSALDFSRYNLIECGQAMLGLAAGLLLTRLLRMGNLGAVVGMVFAWSVWRWWISGRWQVFHAAISVAGC